MEVRTMTKTLLTLLLITTLTSPAAATITVYHDFATYDAAVGGFHSLVIDFATDASNQPVVPGNSNGDEFLDIEGNTFSNQVTYSSPSAPSSRVNIAINTQNLFEIGPYPRWDFILRWDYSAQYIATSFTGVEMEPGTLLSLYNAGQFLASVPVGGTSDVFQFFGFVSSDPFDRVEVNGLFYAIDDHRSTISGLVSTASTSWSAVKALFGSRH
jgi:hypothetical protein